MIGSIRMPEEYTGRLQGGPDEGNLITASVPEVKAVDTLVLHLDGEGKGSTTYVTTGSYCWENTEEGYAFVWKLDDTLVIETTVL